MNSRWRETVIYEFSLQQQEMTQEREPTPIIVDEPQQIMFNIPFIRPRPVSEIERVLYGGMNYRVIERNIKPRERPSGLSIRPNPRMISKNSYLYRREVTDSKRENVMDDMEGEKKMDGKKMIVDDIIVEDVSCDEVGEYDKKMN